MRYTIISFSLLFLFSCSNPDSNAPVVESLRVDGIDGIRFQVTAGSAHEFTLKVSDDQTLSQVRFSMSTGSGFNDYDSDQTLFKSIGHSQWDTVSVVDINGSEAYTSSSFYAPDSASGLFNFEGAVIDANGNLSAKKFKVFILNPLFPSIVVSSVSPAYTPGETWTLQTSDVPVLTGSASDSDGLVQVDITIKKGSTIAFEQTYSAITNDFDLSQIVIPSLTESGSYSFTIVATDQYGTTQTARAEGVVQ